MFLGKPVSVETLVKAIGSVIKPTPDAISL
jgi:hypothetical protein